MNSGIPQWYGSAHQTGKPERTLRAADGIRAYRNASRTANVPSPTAETPRATAEYVS